MKIKRWAFTTLVLFVILTFAWLVLKDKSTKSYIYSNYGVDLPMPDQLLGIDVSHYQHTINWVDVNNMNIGSDSISFTYLKLSEGKTLVDDYAEKNTNNLLESDLYFGYYHFFRPSISAKKQADFFTAQPIFSKANLIPVIDVEISEGMSNKKLNDSVLVFLNLVEKKTKVRPMIYTNESMFNDNFCKSFLKNEKYWIANYNGNSEAYKKNNNVIIWQFSDEGTVNGISSKVDMNICKPELFESIKTKKE